MLRTHRKTDLKSKWLECIPLILACALMNGCGSSDSDDGNSSSGKEDVHVRLEAINASVATGRLARVASTRTVADCSGVDETIYSNGIFSGAPDSFKVKLKSIQFGNETAWKSDSSAGTEIELSSGEVDLAAAGVTDIRVAAGTYSNISLTFAPVAKITGCVTGTIDGSGPLPSEAPTSCGNGLSSERITGGAHTFCTSSALTVVGKNDGEVVGALDDYAASGATETEIYLSKSFESRSNDVTVSTDVDFEVTSDGTNPITVAIDLNRILRFFSNARSDCNTPNPGWPQGTSYFFTSVFENSVAAFAGEPGSIEGYQSFVDNGGGTTGGWVTLIRDADGKLLSGIAMPNDDNDLTILKGGLTNMASIDTSAASYSLPFSLGNNGVATIANFTRVETVGNYSCAELDTNLQGSDQVYSPVKLVRGL